jgi:hypothetical protein
MAGNVLGAWRVPPPVTLDTMFAPLILIEVNLGFSGAAQASARVPRRQSHQSMPFPLATGASAQHDTRATD